MNRPAILRAMICTPWGHYAPGLQVTVVHTNGPEITVCLDNQHHPAGVCHYQRIDRSELYIPHDRQSQAA